VPHVQLSISRALVFGRDERVRIGRNLISLLYSATSPTKLRHAVGRYDMQWRGDHPMNQLEIIISTILLVRHSSTVPQGIKDSASAVDAYCIHACTEHLLIGAIHNRVSWFPCSHSYLSSTKEQVQPWYDKRMLCNAQFHYTAVDARSCATTSHLPYIGYAEQTLARHNIISVAASPCDHTI
jgi:hypothetical protein